MVATCVSQISIYRVQQLIQNFGFVNHTTHHRIARRGARALECLSRAYNLKLISWECHRVRYRVLQFQFNLGFVYFCIYNILKKLMTKLCQVVYKLFHYSFISRVGWKNPANYSKWCWGSWKCWWSLLKLESHRSLSS